MKTSKLSNSLKYLTQAYLGYVTSRMVYTIRISLLLFNIWVIMILRRLYPLVGMISILAFRTPTRTVLQQ
jgi:hypothetical protein